MTNRRNLAKSLAILVLLLSYMSILCFAKADSPATTTPTNNEILQNLINQAKPGGTIILSSGIYVEQTLQLNKAISIIGQNSDDTIIQFNPKLVSTGSLHLDGKGGVAPDYSYESAVKIGSNNVTLSNLTLKSDNGNIFVIGNNNQITNCTLEIPLLLQGSFNNISLNIINEAIACLGANNYIQSNTLIGAGIGLAGNGNTVYNNIIQNSTVSVSVTGSASFSRVYDNKIINNQMGLLLYGQGSNNEFFDNYVANNGFGVLLSYTYYQQPGGNNSAFHNNFVDNNLQIKNSPNSTDFRIFPTGYYDNGKEGNYWSDYKGTDNNNDGIGDTQYAADPYQVDRYPLIAHYNVANDINGTSLPSASVPELSWFVILTLLIATFSVTAMLCHRKQVKGTN